ncbi:MAG: hypothetical protein QNJ68_20440 [Microcoleaceae cyanobacterium MO_207.B10]|nr:hypothetical protein [Microcoleaceae cyanobacterium MO_207.B10]
MSAYFSHKELKKLPELIQKTQGLLSEGYPGLEPIQELLELLQDVEVVL